MARAGRLNASCPSPSTWPSSSPIPGITTPLAETIDSFERLCNGEADDLPESAFMYVGNLDEARAKAEQMAAAAAG